MRAMAGADVHSTLGAEGPAGLVAEPANYPRCIAAAKLLAPRSFFNQLRLTRSEIEAKCRGLYASVKAQALGFLIIAAWTEAASNELHIATTAAEMKEALLRATRDYPRKRTLRAYLAKQQWSLSDLLFILRQQILAHKLLGPQSPAPNGDISATPSTWLRTADRTRMTARTVCSRGYVVLGCNEYRGRSAGQLTTPRQILATLVR
jgi:hypothetical protein